MPGKYVSVGLSKLCHKKFSGLSSSESASLMTRFPESSSCATGFFTDLDVVGDQTLPPPSLRRTRIPGSMNFRMLDLFVRGFCLLAIQTTTGNVLFLYHVARYQFSAVLPGLQNPSSNIPAGETSVSAPVMF